MDQGNLLRNLSCGSINIWKFRDAPTALQALHIGTVDEPEWIAQVDSNCAQVFERLLGVNLELQTVVRHALTETIVYIGQPGAITGPIQFENSTIPTPEMKRTEKENDRYATLRIKHPLKAHLEAVQKKLEKEFRRDVTISEVLGRLLSYESKLSDEMGTFIEDVSLASAFPHTMKWHLMLEALLNDQDRTIVEGVKNYIARVLFTLVAGNRSFSLGEIIRMNRLAFRTGRGPKNLRIDLDFEVNEPVAEESGINSEKRHA
jgi:hypothetical protein